MSQSSQIVEIYKSRKTMISLLKRQDYDVGNYSEFSIHEVHTMFQTKQLDMLFTKEDGSKKAYVKYHLAKSLRPVNIYEYIDSIISTCETFLIPSYSYSSSSIHIIKSILLLLFLIELIY